MNIHRLTVLFAITALILACNYPTYVRQQEVPLNPEIQSQPPQVLPQTQAPLPIQQEATPSPSNTPLPTDTPTVTLTSTPTIPIAWAKDVPVNCRFGPGKEWAAISALEPGQTAEIAGKNAEGTWWYVKDPLHAGGFCWAAMSVTNAAGNLASIPVVGLPSALVTKVTVSANPSFTACGGPNQVAFSGKLTVNGPVKVTYRWEIGGDKQNIAAEESVKFTEAGTKVIVAPAYHVDCGNFFVILHVLSPNDKSAKENFKVP